MMVGNHDWFYHLPGAAHHATRTDIVDAFGLAKETNGGPFLHSLDPITVHNRAQAVDYGDSAHWLREKLAEHGALARHGDVFDQFNFDAERGRDASSLGDCMVTELLNRFPFDVAKALNKDVSTTSSWGSRRSTTSAPCRSPPRGCSVCSGEKSASSRA